MAKNFSSIYHLLSQSGTSKEVKEERVPSSKTFEGRKKEIEIKEMREHEPEESVAPFIQTRKETVELPEGLKTIGVTATPSTKFPSYHTVTLPLPREKIIKGLHASLYSSFRWLATLTLYIIQSFHATLKDVHGKILKVTENS